MKRYTINYNKFSSTRNYYKEFNNFSDLVGYLEKYLKRNKKNFDSMKEYFCSLCGKRIEDNDTTYAINVEYVEEINEFPYKTKITSYPLLLDGLKQRKEIISNNPVVFKLS